jgi:hypothetical protein
MGIPDFQLCCLEVSDALFDFFFRCDEEQLFLFLIYGTVFVVFLCLTAVSNER